MRRARRFPWLTFLVVYTAFVFYATTIPFRLRSGASAFGFWYNALVSPGLGAHLGRLNVSLADVVQNVLLFVPLGFAAWAARRPRRALVGIVAVGLLGLAVSAIAETLQLYARGRTPSLVDCATNGLGALAGGALAALATRWLAGAAARPWLRRAALGRGFYPMLVLAGVWLADALRPYDLSIDPGFARTDARLWLDGLTKFGTADAADAARAFLLAVVATAFALRWATRATRGRARVFATCVAGAIVVVALHFVVRSRVPSVWAALAGILGAIAAIPLAPRLGRGATVPVITATTALAYALDEFRPFRLADAYRGFHWIPFLFHYRRSVFGFFDDTFGELLRFVPLGFALGLDRKRPRRLATALAVATTIAACEALQGFMFGRHADLTDVLTSLVGVASGMLLAHRGWRSFRARVFRAPGDGPRTS
jgi:glycopeptide antibiotics resistance protein